MQKYGVLAVIRNFRVLIGINLRASKWLPKWFWALGVSKNAPNKFQILINSSICFYVDSKYNMSKTWCFSHSSKFGGLIGIKLRASKWLPKWFGAQRASMNAPIEFQILINSSIFTM